MPEKYVRLLIHRIIDKLFNINHEFELAKTVAALSKNSACPVLLLLEIKIVISQNIFVHKPDNLPTSKNISFKFRERVVKVQLF